MPIFATTNSKYDEMLSHEDWKSHAGNAKRNSVFCRRWKYWQVLPALAWQNCLTRSQLSRLRLRRLSPQSTVILRILGWSGPEEDVSQNGWPSFWRPVAPSSNSPFDIAFCHRYAEALAAPVVWRLSDSAARITGQVWSLDGGFSAIRPLVK